MGDYFSIADVARLRDINYIKGRPVTKISSSETYCDCPFCGKSGNQFSYNISKGVYHCWSCEARGNAIDLWINTSNEEYTNDAKGRKEAAKDIYTALNGDVEIMAFHRKDHESLNNSNVVEADLASDSIRNNTYRHLLDMLELKTVHAKDLMRRGLTLPQIEKIGFRTVPVGNTTQLCQDLINQGCILEGVPGFYLNNKNKWELNIPAYGYMCPVYDGNTNYILGFQIRLDKPLGNAKYMWIASKDKNKGVTSGALTTYLPGKNNNIIILTEGILKATIIWVFLKGQVSVIGIPGVNAKTSLRSVLDTFSMAYVYEAFDMDKAIRPEPSLVNEDLNYLKQLVKDFKDGKKPVFNNVPLSEEMVIAMKEYVKTTGIANAAEDLCEICSSEYNFSVHHLTWDFAQDRYWNKQYKGLDDFLLEYDDRDKFISYIIAKAEKNLKMQKYFADCSNM